MCNVCTDVYDWLTDIHAPWSEEEAFWWVFYVGLVRRFRALVEAPAA